MIFKRYLESQEEARAFAEGALWAAREYVSPVEYYVDVVGVEPQVSGGVTFYAAVIEGRIEWEKGDSRFEATIDPQVVELLPTKVTD